MDPFFIVSLITLVIAFIGLIVWKTTTKTITVERGYSTREYTNEAHLTAGVAFLVGVALTVVFFFLSTFVVVKQAHVGEEVNFGKAQGTLSVGWHWKSPTSTVKRYDGTLQTEKYSTDKDDQGDPFQVTLYGGSTAFVNLTYQWRLSGDIDSIYKNYPTTGTDVLNTNVVKRDVQLALNEAYASYNPYQNLENQQLILAAQQKGQAPPAIQPALTYVDFAKTALTQVTTELSPQGISAISLVISSISFDPTTQANINSLQNSIISTQKAIQNEITAAATALANQKITANPPTAEQNTQTCLADIAANPAAYAGMVSLNCNFGTASSSVTPLVTTGK